MSDPLIPRKEFARRLGVPVRTLDRWKTRGCFGVKLPAVLVGDRVRYGMAEYEAWQQRVREARARARARKIARPAPRARRRRLEAVDANLRRKGML